MVKIPIFTDRSNIDILNWDESLMIFGAGFKVRTLSCISIVSFLAGNHDNHITWAERFFSLFLYKISIFLFQNVFVINYKGEICEPKNIALPPNYGSGIGAAVSNGGILVCGGEKNKWDKDNPYQGGKVVKKSDLLLLLTFFGFG